MHIRKKDKVRVIAGNDKGKEGEVLKVFPGTSKIIVEKVNLIKRHAKPSQQMRQGGIIEKEAPLTLSNLMVLCPKCNKPVRTGKKRLEDGKNVRICRKCEDILDK